MRWFARPSATCVLGLSLQAAAQVVVKAPQSLVKKFPPRGAIEGSTATFGAPFYGDRVLGRLVWARSEHGLNYCQVEDYTVPEPKTETKGRLINIVMVKRGGCSFTTKVNIADKKGAHAVIIVDKDDSSLTAKDLQNIIVADDGFGGSIKIPSVLISKDDGRLLIEAAQDSQFIVVELVWNLPTNHVVKLDLWMSSASQESLKFLRDFSPKRKILNEVMLFQPRYAVFGMAKGDQSVEDLCFDDSGTFCAEDPDGPGRVKGKDVLLENVRQLCIHELYKKNRSTNEVRPTGTHHAEYAQEFWDYIERLLDRCPLDKFGEECSQKLMQEVNIDFNEVAHCAATTAEIKLKFERDNAAWSPRALRINGWRYSGILDPDLVTRAICSSFIVQPKECQDLIKPRDPFVPFSGDQAPGVSFGTLLGWLFGTLVVAFGALLLYKRFLKKEMRATLREEVMLEVQAQLGEYCRLQGN